MIDYAKILSKKYPESRWRMNGDEYENLEWLSDSEIPSKDELESHWEEVKEQQRLKQVKRKRQLAYQKEADPLFFKWQRGEVEKKEYDDKVAEIRERIPKPELE